MQHSDDSSYYQRRLAKLISHSSRGLSFPCSSVRTNYKSMGFGGDLYVASATLVFCNRCKIFRDMFRKATAHALIDFGDVPCDTIPWALSCTADLGDK